MVAIACVPVSFTDLDLSRWIERNRDGAILVVSDGMPYSQKMISVANSVFRNRSILVLSDREGQGQKRRCDPILASPMLMSRGANRHFPTTFFVKDGKLLDYTVPGMQNPKELAANWKKIDVNPAKN